MTDKGSVTQITGTGIAVRGADIDTDRIIPARFLRTITFDDLGDHAFEDDRKEGGHPFDNPRFSGASVLVVNQNFGCGSSREHAPQALTRWGIKAFVGESFAEIFFGNCVAIGLPCFTAAVADITAVMSAIEGDPQQELALDVEEQTFTWSGGSCAATIPEGARGQFVEGTWDALGQLLEAGDSIPSTAARLPYTSNFAKQL